MFFLFAGTERPLGGMNDFQKSDNNKQILIDAMESAKPHWDWAHVAEIKPDGSFNIVASWEKGTE